MIDILEEFADNFYIYGFAGHLVENDDDRDENEIDFNTVDITEEDSIENHENESKNDG